jgi:hypothetical protein
MTTNPESWPLWLILITYPPMLFGAASAWIGLTKSPRWKRIQIACIIYFYLFGIVFAWGQPIVGFVLIGAGALALLVYLSLKHRNSAYTLPSIESATKRDSAAAP